MGKRKDPLIEFRDYYNSLSPDAQDVARRLLFGSVTTQRPKSSPTAQPARRQSSSNTRKADGPEASSLAETVAAGDAPKLAASAGD